MNHALLVILSGLMPLARHGDNFAWRGATPREQRRQIFPMQALHHQNGVLGSEMPASTTSTM
jgi:hypothetical protein